jgi:putative CocE/NonD family hydrolase
MAPRHSLALRAAVAAGLGLGAIVTVASAHAAPGRGGEPAVTSAPSSLVGLTPQLPPDVIAASSAKHTWKPGKAIYGTGALNDVPVKGAGGTTLRVNEIYPTTADGKPAKGSFPVLLTMTPYGKGTASAHPVGSAQQPGGTGVTGGENDYLVERGYIEVIADVRGTGDSNGKWGLFDPIQQQDSIKLVNWAAHLPNSNGTVGTFGPSYLGIDQLLLAGAVGRHSPLKAIFPMVPANDIYRDTSFMGGLIDFEFDETYLGLTAGTNTANPVGDSLSDPQMLAHLASIEADHAGGLAGYHAATTAQVLAGGPEAYDESYWKARAPQNVLSKVVANGIPAYLVGGEFDIFQRGEPMNYAALQNAWAGRSVTAPMAAGQPVTGRYQLIDGPWEHLNGSAVNLDLLQLEWFDTWLKGVDTGMAETPTPLHYYDLGTGKFRETTTFPFTGASPTTFYFGAGNTLTRTKPVSSGSDTVVWSPSGSPCGRPVDQWSMGGISIPAHSAGFMAPCADDDSASKAPGSTVSYTSKPFAQSMTMAGPITANVLAKATTADTEWVAQIDEVTPSGASYPITSGALLGSFRKVNPARTWRVDGTTVLPYHDYTRASAQPVQPGALADYQIEIFPTLITIAAGDSLRITLSTADTPHLTPDAQQLPHLLGGVYTIARSPQAASSLTVSLAHT